MSTYFEYVVDVEATIEEAQSLAVLVTKHLLHRRIILATPQLHEISGQSVQFATGPKVASVADHNDCFPCDLDISIKRQVYVPGEYGLEKLGCPDCHQNHSPDELDWGRAVVAWLEKVGDESILCQKCGISNSVTSWRFEPVWGFGNLAFEFSEWYLKETFVAELSTLLGHRVAWVKCRL